MLLFKYLPERTRKLARANPSAIRYVIDCFFVISAVNIASSNFNLFAVRLGANDYQLSLIQFLPQILTMLVLIPGGILMDSLYNKKRIVIVTLAALMLGMLLCCISPFFTSFSIQFFLGSLAFAGVWLALHNIAWQSFFPGVIGESTRNHVLTLRTRMLLFIGMIVPLLVGVVLTNIESVSGKIKAHQIFFACSVLLFLLGALNFRKFRIKWHVEPKRISLSEIKTACKSLLFNKPFVLFAITAMFFHMTWHFDWTLYFIGQAHYLKMNEFQLGLVPLSAAAIQLITLKFWSRKNERYGVVLPFTFGILGLSLCPAFLAVAVSLQIPAAPYIFVALHMLAHIPFCVVTLNLFQCLLQVVDHEYRSFYMSVFACLLCLSNAVMPVAGVALYHKLGGDLNGFRYALAIIFVLRLVAAGLWLLRWRATVREQR
ncbi:MAG: MFS transporter [Treponema sp.]|nr:MFS transporter [Treponema sp.]